MKPITIIFFLLLTSTAFSQSNEKKLAVSLEDAIDIAYKNNLTLREQNLDVKIAETEVDQYLATGLPQINASFDYQWNILNAFAERTDVSGESETIAPLQQFEYTAYPNVDYSSLTDSQQLASQAISTDAIGGFFSLLGDAFVARHQSNAGISVNQKVYDGVFALGLEAANVFIELSEAQLAPTKRDINKAVEKAYYGVLITQANIDIITQNQENLSALINETTEIYNAGFAEQLDVDRLQLSFSILENSKKSLETIEQFNYDVLKNAMNIPLSSELELIESIEEFERYALGDEIIAEMVEPELWPEFQVLDVQEKLQNIDIQRIEKGRLPLVNAFLNGGYNYQGNDFIFTNGFDSWFPNLAVGVTASMPIFDGNFRKNQIKQKQLELEKIYLSRETLQTNIDIQIQNAITVFTNARTDIQTQKDNIALAQKIYDITQIKYREGVGSSLEVYQAQQDLYSAQQSYINSLYDLLIAKVDLEQALGK